ncbi:hypothetical protein ACUXAV_000298 [Cupriavidus metallidurans]|uniref:hypothetical protein n=1 Tax=Cupriavidus metallidurans TaxID=119219 RepID=UPI0004933B79|nr:hypothetical protein [Cupriavidus metallidurans]MDE4918255.1 hypothetical protein [Cupriavidus metallidurans]
MPRLSAAPRPPAPAAGYEPSPIDPHYDRYYILDAAGQPVRVYDHGEHARWESFEGKAWQIKDILPECAVDVWTYFAAWASLKDDRPPMFRTTISGSMTRCYESLTWEEAEDKHRRVLDKIWRTVPRRDEL